MRINEYEYEFCCNLHAKLKEEAKGKVFTTVEDDTLYVKILNGYIRFDMAFEDFSDIIYKGVTSNHIACEVIKKYRKYINGLYFHN